MNQSDPDAEDIIYDAATFIHLSVAVLRMTKDLRRIVNRSNILSGLEDIGQPR